jgi:hypothetical protein
VNRWNPELLGDRTRPAWRAMVRVLADGEWHAAHEVWAGAEVVAPDLAPKTIENLFLGARSEGYLTRRGRSEKAEWRLTQFALQSEVTA